MVIHNRRIFYSAQDFYGQNRFCVLLFHVNKFVYRHFPLYCWFGDSFTNLFAFMLIYARHLIHHHWERSLRGRTIVSPALQFVVDGDVLCTHTHAHTLISIPFSKAMHSVLHESANNGIWLSLRCDVSRPCLVEIHLRFNTYVYINEVKNLSISSGQIDNARKKAQIFSLF